MNAVFVARFVGILFHKRVSMWVPVNIFIIPYNIFMGLCKQDLYFFNYQKIYNKNSTADQIYLNVKI